MTALALRSFRLENFKVVRDSGTVKFGPLTVFIGNNGSGKSSLVEGLETFRDIVVDGLDAAMRRWRGFEHVWNRAAKHTPLHPKDPRAGHTHPMTFRINMVVGSERIVAEQQINLGKGGNRLFIQREESCRRSKVGSERFVRDAEGRQYLSQPPTGRLIKGSPQLEDGRSILHDVVNVGSFLESWQFLFLSPDAMGQPVPQQRATERVRLARTGANIAEYLNDIRERDLEAFNSILDSLRYVLPFGDDLQPVLTSELERTFYLKLKEEDFEVPGWLLSTGTLRILALLACLRHPDPPPLLVVEEIENGLDPRTLHLLVEEIRAAVTAGTTQVIATTHSPYLLDLLDLSHIVVVEREDGQPTFKRPNEEELATWAKSFSPGRLYTMGRLTRGD
jgi:predicted ATPase